MKPLLERRDPRARRGPDVTRLLALAPWLWPASKAERAALAASTGITLPRLHPGEVLLVTVSDRGAGVWGAGVEAASEFVPLGLSATRAWDTARAAVSRSAVVLWSGAADVQPPSSAVRLDALARTGRAAIAEPLLDGESFGLSFFLAIASMCYGVPVRTSVAASAEIDADGRLRAVDSATLPDKLAAIEDLAPAITTVIVARDQQTEAEAAAGALGLSRVRIRGAERAQDVLPWALMRSPRRLLGDAGRSPVAREAIVERLFQLAIQGRRALVDWTPVEDACRFVLDARNPARWRGVSAREQWHLRFVQAVAARHERNGGRLPPFERRFLTGRSAHEVLSVVANYVQHGADTGRPELRVVRRLLRAYLPARAPAHLAHARIMGSHARHCAMRGRLREALAWQQKAAEILCASGADARAESSHQFSEWFRLAGALGSTPEFDAAERSLRTRFGRTWPFDATGHAYVRLARCQALVMLGRPAEAVEGLRAISEDGRAPDNPISSALRWLVRALDECGRGAEADTLLRETAFRDPPHSALVAIDRAVRARDGRAAARAIRELASADPGPMRHILAVAPRDTLRRARLVQQLYPY